MDIKNPDPKEYNVPVDRVSKDISELDVAGKIVEVTNYTIDDVKRKARLMTQYEANKLNYKEPWFDIRGLNATLANQVAVERGATMILYVQSDQPVYRNAIGLKKEVSSVMLYQFEFVGNISVTKFELADPPPHSPYDDSAFTYYAHPECWFYGGCAPVVYGDRFPSAYMCAHLRHANPQGISEKEKFEHFYGRLWFRYYTNEGLNFEEIDKRAREEAKKLLEIRGKKTPFAPPEVCFTKPKDYVLQFLEK